MTVYHTFDIDSVPAPSDFELEAADRRMRKHKRMPDWMREALVEMEDEQDEKSTQGDALGILF